MLPSLRPGVSRFCLFWWVVSAVNLFGPGGGVGGCTLIFTCLALFKAGLVVGLLILSVRLSATLFGCLVCVR